jgi:hypothetical protein
VPADLQTLLYYAAGILIGVGIVIGARIALRARQEAREGVDLVTDADMLSEFQRARDSGEMDDAEFQRVGSPGASSSRGIPLDERPGLSPSVGQGGRTRVGTGTGHFGTGRRFAFQTCSLLWPSVVTVTVPLIVSESAQTPR